MKPPGRENPLCAVHFECELSIGTRDARKALWPAAGVRPHTKAGHMAAPTSTVQKLKKTLANGEPSTQGRKRVLLRYLPPQAEVAPSRLARRKVQKCR